MKHLLYYKIWLIKSLQLNQYQWLPTSRIQRKFLAYLHEYKDVINYCSLKDYWLVRPTLQDSMILSCDIELVLIGVHSPSIWIMWYCLREYLTATHILDRKSESLSIFDLRLIHDSLNVGLLNFTVLCPHKFSTWVHWHGRFFSTQFNQNWALIVAQSNIIRPL